MTKNEPVLKELSFDIDSSIVFQLGESLISDSVQAVTELVKNSYDADASYCILDVVTDEKVGKNSRRYSNALGYITVEDDGHGMTEDQLRDGFLVISASFKREMKRKSLTTKGGRTPLGDKGLGRLSAQRLAENVEIYTTPLGSKEEYYLAFSWNDFLEHNRLSQVKVKYEVRPTTGKPGTKLVLSGLKYIDDWTGKAKDELGSKLSKMISPYKEKQDFNLLATIDGTSLDLTLIAEKLRDAAQLRYSIEFDGKTLRFEGLSKLDYMYPADKKRKNQFNAFIVPDKGKKLLEFLSKDKSGKSLKVRKADDGWFVAYSRSFIFDEMDGLETINRKRANPGPFRGEIDSFDFETYKTAGEADVFNKRSDFKKVIESISGVRVYRDGFGVRVDQDWLGLGKQWTFATSYYTLRPANTLGYVSISAEHNKQLEETTDREGFKDTPYLRNFLSLMHEFVKFSADGQEFLRRGSLKFFEDLDRQEADAEEEDEPEQVTAKAKAKVQKASSVKANLSSMKSSILKGGSKASMRRMAQNAVEKAEIYVDEVSNLTKDLDYVETQIGNLRRQMDQMYETVGLGLTAEALSHEISNVTDQLASRNKKVNKHVQDKPIRDALIISHIEYIGSTVNALRKQLSHLSPSLRYIREKKENIKLEKFFLDIIDFYFDRMKTNGIRIDLVQTNSKNFVVKMNVGKLTQVVDNLLLNSEYWLREDIRTERLEKGVITIELDDPLIRVSDNGKGFDKSIEETAFEPFTTMKGAGKGRGLGLFIATQLLDSDGCKITLGGKRNKSGRLHTLELNMAGVCLDD